jgi:hypothetical protein
MCVNRTDRYNAAAAQLSHRSTPFMLLLLLTIHFSGSSSHCAIFYSHDCILCPLYTMVVLLLLYARRRFMLWEQLRA